ncbi:MAG: ATP-grasp domain-containing protein [Planctomycetes bacterium]|nr:ATP-grasp domain-containing protein [Planctomycetota bacterium]
MIKRKSKSESDSQEFNILFTCVGRRVVILRAFKQALAELGLAGRTVGTDITSAAPGLHAVDHAEIVPQVRTLHYVPRLQELVDKYKIRLLVPFTDIDLRTLSRHIPEFEQLGCTVMVAPEQTLTACRNKIKFNDLVSKAGLKCIHTRDLRSFRAQPFYPCFIKPVHGSAAIGSSLVRNDRELRAHIGVHGTQLMCQEYIPGQEYTIDVFRRRDGLVCAVVPRQRLAIRSGEVEKALTVNDSQLIDATVKLVNLIPGLWGVLNAQCRRPAGGEPHFFELNPRFGGGAPLTLAAGVDLPKLVIMEVLGQTVAPTVGQFTDGLLMLRYDEAVFTKVDDASRLPGYKEPINK